VLLVWRGVLKVLVLVVSGGASMQNLTSMISRVRKIHVVKYQC
jgi:hypothetical protein